MYKNIKKIYTSQNERYLQLKVHSSLGPESVRYIRDKQLKTDLEKKKKKQTWKKTKAEGKGESRTVEIF